MKVLEGKAALVTGSARGIGRAAAALLAEHGASVMIADLDEGLAQQTAAELERPDRRLRRRPDAGGRLRGARRSRRSTRSGSSTSSSTTPATRGTGSRTGWATTSSGRCSRSTPSSRSGSSRPRRRTSASPAKQEAAEGREVFRKVVNVTSIAGTQGNVGQANYSAAKAGLVGLTKTLAREWGPSKVNVNAVAFGFVETRLTRRGRGRRDLHERRRRRDPARDPRADARARVADHPARPRRRRPRRPRARSSSSARPGRTSSTARSSPPAAARRRG